MFIAVGLVEGGVARGRDVHNSDLKSIRFATGIIVLRESRHGRPDDPAGPADDLSNWKGTCAEMSRKANHFSVSSYLRVRIKVLLLDDARRAWGGAA